MGTHKLNWLTSPIAAIAFAGLSMILPRVTSAADHAPQGLSFTWSDSGDAIALADGVSIAVATGDGDEITTIVIENDDDDGSKAKRKAKRKRKKTKRKHKNKRKREKRGDEVEVREHAIILNGRGVRIERIGDDDVRVYVGGKEHRTNRNPGNQCETFEADGAKIVICGGKDFSRELQRMQRDWNKRRGEVILHHQDRSSELRRQYEAQARERAVRAAERARRDAERAAAVAREQAHRAERRAEEARVRAERARRDAERALREAQREQARAQQRRAQQQGRRHDL